MTKAEELAARFEQKYGHKAGAIGATPYTLNVIPTGSLALDYALGTGGWPLGHPVEVFGAPDIGKSSVLGFSAIRNAQKMGKMCVIIATEPGFDAGWARANGVDPEGLAIGRPDDGEEAFSMLADSVRGGAEYIVFDSIGALLRKAETQEDAGPSAMGQAALITWGTKHILMPCWKNDIGVMFLNQQRQDTKSRVQGVMDSPGGEALKHLCAVRVHLKTAGPAYMAKVNGEDMEVGKKLVAVVKRNKTSEGSRRRAEFDYYSKATIDHPIGIDVGQDVIATGMRTRVIESAGAYYRHPTFPADKNGKHQLQGRIAVTNYLLSHEDAMETIRQEVLEVMVKQRGPLIHIRPDLEVVNGS